MNKRENLDRLLSLEIDKELLNYAKELVDTVYFTDLTEDLGEAIEFDTFYGDFNHVQVHFYYKEFSLEYSITKIKDDLDVSVTIEVNNDKFNWDEVLYKRIQTLEEAKAFLQMLYVIGLVRG